MASVRKINYSKSDEFEDIDISMLETQEGKEDLASNYTQEQAQSILAVYQKIKGDDEKERKFKELYSLMDNMNQTEWSESDGQNICRMDERDGVQTLRIKNLGGSGLDVALTDDSSFIIEKDGTLTKAQVEAFARLFCDHGMNINSFSNVTDLKIVDEQGKEIGNFEQVFSSYVDEYNQQNERLSNVAEDPSNQSFASGAQNDSGASETQNNDSNIKDVSFQHYIDAAEKDKKPSISASKKAILDRSGIMRINKRCIRQRRMPDGSYVISFYDSEADKRNDGKLDKDGIVQHKKKVGFRIYPTKPPKVGIYVPQGKKFETAFAKGALKALKSQGYNYFVVPSGIEFGGDAQGAFWEAAGDQLVCPRLKRYPDDPNGCDMGADHIAKVLKALNDKGADDSKDVLLFKMRLAAEVKAFNKRHNDRDKENSELDNVVDKLEGDCKLYYFKNSTVTQVNDYISAGINGEYGEKWNQIDVACAYEAFARLTEGVYKGSYTDEKGNEHTFPEGYDYLKGGNNEFVEKFIKEQMEACRSDVIKTFEDKLSKGGEDIDPNSEDHDPEKEADNRKNNQVKTAASETLTFYTDRIKSITKKCEASGSDYGKGIEMKHSPRAINAPAVSYSNDHFNTGCLRRKAPQKGDKKTPTFTRSQRPR